MAPRAPALKTPAVKKTRAGDGEEPGAEEKPKEAPGKKGSQLKADLAELKRVTFRSPSRSMPRKTERKERKKKPPPPGGFGGGGLGGGGGDSGGSDPSDESSSSSSESEEEDDKSMGSVDWGDSPSGDEKGEKAKKKKKKKKKKSRGKEDEDDDDDKRGDRPGSKKSGDAKKKKKKKVKKNKHAAKEAREDKRKKKKKKKSGKRGIEKLETDKGPFGMGESKKMRKDDEDGDDSDSDETSSSQSFHKAPSGLTLHLRLQRYAMRHPGRLATRLLQRMEKVCRLGGGVHKTGTGIQSVTPCALAYFLTILTPSLKDRWSPRTQRELRVLTEILDHLVEDAGRKAADIIAQRIKALEQSVQDGNAWKKAKYLELIDSDEVTLSDRGELNMMQKEVELE